MPYLVLDQAALEGFAIGTFKTKKGNPSITASLDHYEKEGWLLVDLVNHSQNQGLTKFIFHRDSN